MRYQFAVCDDDAAVLPVLAQKIRYECEKNGIQADVTAFPGSAALENAMRDATFDALFLDIDMPGRDGVEIADRLRSRGSAICLVFLSAREDRVFDTFRSSPLRFVRKGCLSRDLPEAVAAVSRTLGVGQKVKIPLSTPDGLVSVAVDEIMWAESLGKQQAVVTTTGTLEVRHTLKELCEKLEPHGFLQVHRCYVVACRYIFSIESGRLIMDDRRDIPISRYRLAAVKEAFRRSISHGLDAE